MLRNRFLAPSILALAALAAAPAPEPSVDTRARVDEIFREYDRSDSPGCVVGVFRNGAMEYQRGYGMANLELGVALTTQSVLDLASTGKEFSAFAIQLLARDGRLSLDDDIRRWVPEIPSYGKTVTIRHLLHHTGGLRDYLELFDLAGVRDEDLSTSEEALAMLARQKAPNFPPGREHLYSNSGYFLMSVIVKRASGQSLRDFAAEQIFRPLGMTHTQYNDDHARIIANRATGYRRGKTGGFEISMSDFEQNGDGGVLTTVEDLKRWNDIFDVPVVGDRALLDAMLAPGRLADGRSVDYASGLRLSTFRGLPTVGHGGSWAGYRAQFLRFPEQRFTVVCLCNLAEAPAGALARRVAVVYLGDRMRPEEATAEALPAKQEAGSPPAGAFSTLTGAYQNRDTGQVIQVGMRDGRLILDGLDERLVLVPTGSGRFVSGDPAKRVTVDFDSSARGRPTVRLLWEDGEDTDIESFAPISPADAKPAELAKFAGKYASAELETTWRVVVEKEGLFLKYRNAPAEPLMPSVRDSFSVGSKTLAFSRDSAGRVSGFKLSAARVRGLAFVRIPE